VMHLDPMDPRTNKICEFLKSKVAASAILKNKKLWYLIKTFDRFWRNFAQWCILTPPGQHLPIKMENFKTNLDSLEQEIVSGCMISDIQTVYMCDMQVMQNVIDTANISANISVSAATAMIELTFLVTYYIIGILENFQCHISHLSF